MHTEYLPTPTAGTPREHRRRAILLLADASRWTRRAIAESQNPTYRRGAKLSAIQSIADARLERILSTEA